MTIPHPGASDEAKLPRSDFMAKAVEGIKIAMRMKQRMKAKGLLRARAHCPICKGGMITANISIYNGHIHLRCSTPSCVALME